MHTLNRLVVVAVLTAAFVPLMAAHALMAANERFRKQEELYRVLDEVSSHYQSRMQLQSLQSRSERTLEEAEEELPQLAKEKRDVRLQLESVRETLRRYREQSGIDPEDPEALEELFAEGQEQMRSFVRLLYLRGMDGNSDRVSALLRQYLTDSLGSRTEQTMRERAMLRARGRLLGMLVTARQFWELEQELAARHAALSQEYLALQERREHASTQLHASASRQAQIRQITAEVEGQILQMQSELARIDARIRRRAERDLIEMGLLSGREGAYNDGRVVGTPDAMLSWPATGRISAGFMNHSYREFFGVDHKAIDIVVPQGTPVHSAADGVVYLARDGGATGYSYVLIGHRGGTATLYGHLSKISVAKGDDVQRGETIGLGGGTPGTRGAGPMTTGAHLHFEVIRNGEHVDPLRLLPAR